MMWRSRKLVVPMVRLEGLIAAGGRGPSAGLSLAAVGPALEKAFALKKAPAVALVINSPGGSAVQSSLIGKRIRQLSERHKKSVFAFVEDAAASGGYWLAAAADEIFVDESSLVGSIGVIGATFGLHEAIARLGVERRVYTAGDAKSQLDPFRPEDPADVARVKRMLAEIHASFIAHVQARRGDKLKADPGLFEAEVYIGRRAVALGLADGVGDLHGVLSARFGERVQIKPIALRKPPVLARLLGGAGGAAAEGALAAFEARLAYARLGL